MGGFAEILRQVEAQARAASLDSVPVFRGARVESFPGHESAPAPPLRRVVAVYGDQADVANPPAQFDAQIALEFFAKEADAASGAPARLRALRRKMAWLLHPDRVADEPAAAQAMVQVNARIDAELARLR